MSQITPTGFLEIPGADLAKVEEALPVYRARILKEPSCPAFLIEKDERFANRYNVNKQFIDRVAFEFHQQRTSRTTWAEVTTGVKRQYTIHEAGK